METYIGLGYLWGVHQFYYDLGKLTFGLIATGLVFWVAVKSPIFKAACIIAFHALWCALSVVAPIVFMFSADSLIEVIGYVSIMAAGLLLWRIGGWPHVKEVISDIRRAPRLWIKELD